MPRRERGSLSVTARQQPDRLELVRRSALTAAWKMPAYAVLMPVTTTLLAAQGLLSGPAFAAASVFQCIEEHKDGGKWRDKPVQTAVGAAAMLGIGFGFGAGLTALSLLPAVTVFAIGLRLGPWIGAAAGLVDSFSWVIEGPNSHVEAVFMRFKSSSQP